MPFFSNGFRRKIRFDIVSLFLIFVAISCLTIILFTYYRNYKSILDLADMMVSQVNSTLIGKIESVTKQAEMLTNLTQGALSTPKEISSKDERIVSYLINTLKVEPFISSVRIVGIDGSMVGVYSTEVAKVTTYVDAHDKSLPATVAYAVVSIDRSAKEVKETWEYRDKAGNLVDQETLHTPSFDPKKELWVQETVKTPRLHWSPPILNAWGEPVSTISSPLVNAEGVVYGVVGVNLSLHQLSDFITHQKIGKQGKAYILQEDGTILIPPLQKTISLSQEQTKRLLATSFEEMLTHKHRYFLLEKEEQQFFVHFSDFVLSPDIKWMVVIIIPFDDFFANVIKVERQTILISFLLLIFFGVVAFFSSKHISVPIVQLATDVDKLRKLEFDDNPPTKSRVEEIVVLDSSIRAMRSTLKAFSRFVPKEIVKTLITQGKEVKLGGERKEITILFTDIQNFTTASEALPIEKLIHSLSAYFDKISKNILETGGTIDKYIGDSIMAFWGAPNPVPDHAEKACLTALSAVKIQEPSMPDWKTRIGINAGEAVVGNIGTEERINYTAMGNPVNLASRLQSLNKQYGTSILISESVHEKIGTRFITRPLDFVAVKGKKNKITLYELMGVAEKGTLLSATESEVSLCDTFSEAYAHFLQGRFKEAKELFLSIQNKFPEDAPTKLYLERLSSF